MRLLRTTRSVRGWVLVVAPLTCALGLACSDEPAAKPTGLAMGSSSHTPSAPEAEASRSAGTNRAPVVKKVELSPRSPVPGDRLRSSVTAHDPDGDPIELVYRWRVDGRAVGSGNSPDLRISNMRKGAVIELLVSAKDGKTESEPFRATVKVGNQPPQVVGAEIEPAGPITKAHDIGLRPTAIDPDGDILHFETTWRVNGRVIPTDEPVLPKAEFKRGDTITFTLVATDGQSDSHRFNSQAIRVENAPPDITSFPKGFGADGALRYQVVAKDPDGDRLRYKLVKGPKGMEMEAFEGMLTWLPSLSQAGKHPVELEVDDLRGGTWRQSFDLEVEFGAPPAASR